MLLPRSVLAAILASLIPATVLASPVLVDFEGLDDLASVDGLIPGLTFSQATILTAGISLDEFEFPPASGEKVAFDDGGPMRIDFASPIFSVAGRFTYSSPLILEAFDSSGTSLGFVKSLFSSSMALSGDPGSKPLEPLVLAFGGIAYVIITGDPLGESFTLDDLRLSTSPTTVPEPGTTVLLLLATALFAIVRRRHYESSRFVCGQRRWSNSIRSVS